MKKLFLTPHDSVLVQWGMQARASMVTKLTKFSGKQMDFL